MRFVIYVCYCSIVISYVLIYFCFGVMNDVVDFV